MHWLEEKIGYQFKDPELLVMSLTHKSYHNEFPQESKGDNEKLEFLGDAVIDLVLSDLLLKAYSGDGEGGLSKKRASLVNETVLGKLSLDLCLNEHLKLGKGEIQTGGSNKPRLLASAFEAFIGAIYLDSGYEASYRYLETFFEPLIKDLSAKADYEEDYKSRLQEVLQKLFRDTPAYEVEKEEGPAHDRTFYVNVFIRKNWLSKGFGKSKRQAEQDAAKRALEEKIYERL